MGWSFRTHWRSEGCTCLNNFSLKIWTKKISSVPQILSKGVRHIKIAPTLRRPIKLTELIACFPVSQFNPEHGYVPPKRRAVSELRCVVTHRTHCLKFWQHLTEMFLKWERNEWSERQFYFKERERKMFSVCGFPGSARSSFWERWVGQDVKRSSK
jgi:hypothetical protein